MKLRAQCAGNQRARQVGGSLNGPSKGLHLYQCFTSPCLLVLALGKPKAWEIQEKQTFASYRANLNVLIELKCIVSRNIRAKSGLALHKGTIRRGNSHGIRFGGKAVNR